MGCWNETCFMSNLPIKWGDKIALFVLAPSSHQRVMESCYPDDNFIPLGFPIIGEYDEYGGIENFEVDSYMAQYLKTFTKLYRKKMGCDYDKPEYEEYVWSDMEHFLRELCGHSLYVGSVTSKDKQALESVMIHYELYQQLLSDMSSRIPYGQTKTLRELVRQKTISSIAEIQENNKEWQELNLPVRWALFNDFSEKYKYSNDYRWKSLDKIVGSYLTTLDDSVIDFIVDHIVWYRVMLYSRKGYHCYSGGGSQSEEYQLHRIIANFILAKCEERRNDEDEGYQPESVLSETIYWWGD